jgi:hypothetical protein
MKYLIKYNEEWHYDELESNEFLLFSAPDDFEFTKELLKQYLEERGEYCELEDYCVNIKQGKYGYRYCISDMLDFESKKRKFIRQEFIDWLKQFDVQLLQMELI